MWVGYWLGAVAYAVAWIWGGHLERFAAAVLLVVFVIMTLNFILSWESGGNYLTGKIMDWVRFLIFGWFCFQSNRWWPLLMTATLGMMALVQVVGLVDPTISQWAVSSAKIGLGYLVDLTLLLAVGERWLAGEEPAGRAAWARADIATTFRRNRKMGSRRSGAGRIGLWKQRTDSPRGQRPRLPA